jgi:hypothetical protein
MWHRSRIGFRSEVGSKFRSEAGKDMISRFIVWDDFGIRAKFSGYFGDYGTYTIHVKLFM